MNINKLFTMDERVQNRNPKKEIKYVYLYALLFPRQLKYVRRWRKSLRKGASPITDAQPWVSYGCIDFLNKTIKDDMKVFEYGSGGSTLFFASRAGKVYSVEHDNDWFKIMNGIINKKSINNVIYKLQKPTKLKKEEYHKSHYGSSRDATITFENYVKEINKYPNNFFDIVVVDGRSRNACVVEAFSKVKHKGYIVLDNSQREDYYPAFQFMQSKKCHLKRYFGLLGYETFLNETAVWKVRK
jgi:precorrin-6B methylase 2